MVSIIKKILWLLLTGSLFSMFALNFGFCAESSNVVPFSYDELSGQVEVTSPVKNFNYSESDIVVNAGFYIGGIEYEPNTHYLPYQNISLVYSLDSSEWQNMTLVSAVKCELFPSIPNNFWYSNMWLNYTATLHNVSGGPHYLRIGVRPDSIGIIDIYRSQNEPLVYFNVINQPSTQRESIPIIGLIIVTILAVTIFAAGSLIYIKKVKPKKAIET